MRKNGYTIVELVVVLAVFSVGYFIAVIAISGKVGFNFEEELYNEKLRAFETQASIYAKSDESLFTEEDTVYVTVGELAEKNVIISNKDGKVVDPRNNDNDLNNVKIKLIKKKDSITAKILN